MAEICCQEAKSPPATAATVATVSASAAAAAVASSVMDRRRRRLELKRFRLATDLEQSAAEYAGARKRPRIPRTVSGPCPDAASASENTERCPRFGFSSVCGRRREMEDAVSIRPGFLPGSGKSHFFGVFDGHGCSHVATTCQELMHEAVAEEHEKAGSGEEPVWKEVMERSFARLDERAANWATNRSSEEPACRCEQKMPSRCDHVGSTAVVAVVNPTQIVVANAGDSRAVLSRAGVPIALSVDHKPDRPDELERIQAAGGRAGPAPCSAAAAINPDPDRSMEMWKYRAVGSVAALLLLLAVVVPFTQTRTRDKAAMTEEAGPLVGGIQDSPMGQENDLDVIELARFAVSEHNNKANALLEFENVVKLKKQTVAGTMYYITIRVTEGGYKKLYEAKVWEKLWENFKQLQEFKPVEDAAIA